MELKPRDTLKMQFLPLFFGLFVKKANIIKANIWLFAKNFIDPVRLRGARPNDISLDMGCPQPGWGCWLEKILVGWTHPGGRGQKKKKNAG